MRPITIVVILAVIGVAVGLGTGSFGGLAPVIDGSGEGGDTGDEPAEGGNGSSSPTRDMENTEAAFDVSVDEVTECGQTCRDVTATVTNVGTETAGDVTVELAIYTDGDRIWRGSVDVGTLEPDRPFTTTERIELGYGDALKVQQNDGWITIETVVRFDAGTEVFSEERQVI